MDPQTEEVHVTTEQARGGKTGVGLRYVLMVSLVLAVVAMAAIWLLGARGPEQSGQAVETTEAAVDASAAPEPAAS